MESCKINTIQTILDILEEEQKRNQDQLNELDNELEFITNTHEMEEHKKNSI